MHTYLLYRLMAFLLLSTIGSSLLFGQGIYEVRTHNLWGLIDTLGQEVLPTQYDWIYGPPESAPEQGYYIVVKDGQEGLYHFPVGEIISPQYDKLTLERYDDEIVYVSFQQDGKVGLIDTAGNLMYPAVLDEVVPLSKYFTAVRSDGKWGAWSPHYPFVLEMLYDSVWADSDQILITAQDGRYNSWSAKGENLIRDFTYPFSYLNPDFISFVHQDIQETYEFTWGPDSSLIDSVSREVHVRYGLAKSNGEIVSAPRFDTIRFDFRAVVGELTALQPVQRKEIRVWDSQGKPLLDTLTFDYHIDKSGYLWSLAWLFDSLQTDTGLQVRGYTRWGIFTPGGDTLFPFQYMNRGDFEFNVAVVQGIAGMGLVNIHGEYLSEPTYDYIRAYHKVALCRKDGKRSQIAYDEQGRREDKLRLVIAGGGVPPGMRGGGSTVPISATGGGSSQFSAQLPSDRTYRRINGGLTIVDSAGKRITKEVFLRAEVLPNTNLIIAYKGYSSVDDLTTNVALINHRTGKVLIPFDRQITEFYPEDLASGPVMRARYPKGVYTLVDTFGRIRPIERVLYLDKFYDRIAIGKIGGYYKRNAKLKQPNPNAIWGGKLGYLYQGGKWMMRDLEDARPFQLGIGIYKKNKKWGAIDKRFRPVVPTAFDEISLIPQLANPEKVELPEAERNQLVITQMNHPRYFYYDTLGKQLYSHDFLDGGDFYEGVARVKTEEGWGFINLDGQIEITPRNADIGDFHEGLAKVKRKYRWGFIDHQDSLVIKDIYRKVGNFRYGLAYAQTNTNFNYGYLRQDGTWAIKPNLDLAYSFVEGAAIVKKKGYYGLIDTLGKWILRPIYHKIERRGERYLRVKMKENYGIYTFSGEEVLPIDYAISDVVTYGMLRIVEGNKRGLVDLDYQIVVPPTYDAVSFLTPDLIIVREGWAKKAKFGLLSREGKVLLPLAYASIKQPNGGELLVVKYGSRFKQKLSLETFKDSLPAPYEEPKVVSSFAREMQRVAEQYEFITFNPPHEGIVVGAATSQYGIFGVKAREELFAPQFEYLQIRPHFLQVYYKGNIGYMDYKGNWIYRGQ